VIPDSITFVNGKGGVGKTSICVNTAGLLANSGWKVLIVELDKQANLARNLGYRDHPDNDHGKALFQALLIEDHELTVPLRDVRPGLDVISAGKTMKPLAAGLTATRFDHLLLGRKLAPLAGDYDLILIDAPPDGGPMTQLALGASEGVVIPVNADYGTLDGLEIIGEDFAEAREAGNTLLRLLGVALFQMPTSATRVREEIRDAAVEVLAGIAPVFESEIRQTTAAGFHQRRDARLSYEYEHAAQNEIKDKMQALKSGDRTALAARGAGYSSSASGLAADYAGLVEEIIIRLRDRSGVAV